MSLIPQSNLNLLKRSLPTNFFKSSLSNKNNFGLVPPKYDKLKTKAEINKIVTEAEITLEDVIDSIRERPTETTIEEAYSALEEGKKALEESEFVDTRLKESFVPSLKEKITELNKILKALRPDGTKVQSNCNKNFLSSLLLTPSRADERISGVFTTAPIFEKTDEFENFLAANAIDNHYKPTVYHL